MSIASDRPHAYTYTDLRLLSTITANLGVAIENARLQEETQQRLSELATINMISQGLLAQLDLQAAVEQVGDKIHGILNPAGLDITLYDHHTNILTQVYLCDHSAVPVLALRLDQFP